MPEDRDLKWWREASYLRTLYRGARESESPLLAHKMATETAVGRPGIITQRPQFCGYCGSPDLINLLFSASCRHCRVFWRLSEAGGFWHEGRS